MTSRTRIARQSRVASAFVMRLFLLAPLAILRGLLWGIAAAADKMADGLSAAETSLRPLCSLPFHAELKRALDDAKAEEKRRLLEVLERATR